MIYCNLLSMDGSLATYAISCDTHDMTGRLEVDYKTDYYRLLKRPEKSVFYDPLVRHVVARGRYLYDKGIVKDRLAYEIG